MSDPVVFDRIRQDIKDNDVVLYMKGTPVFPQCGFSAAVVEVLSDGTEEYDRGEKLEHYRECFEDRRFESHYGFPNSVVLFVTTSSVRMNSMMKLCRTVIGPCSYLLFAHTKDWANEPHFPYPGDLLGPFQRVGHPPFNLATLGE